MRAMFREKSAHLLWALLFLALTGVPAWAADDDDEKPPKEELIAQALDYRVSVDVRGALLPDLLDYLADVLPDDQKISIVVARQKISEAGISLDHPVSLKVRDVRLRSALALILSDSGLNWTIRDEVLLITTQEAAAANLVTRVYDVNDLVVQKGSDKPADFDELIEVVESSVAPQSWSSASGPATIRPFSTNGGRLVVSQTPQAHYEIARLIEDLQNSAHEPEETQAPAPAAADDKAAPAEKRGDTDAKGDNNKGDADASGNDAADKDGSPEPRTAEAKKVVDEEMLCPRTKR